jgi:hypothetical protein
MFVMTNCDGGPYLLHVDPFVSTAWQKSVSFKFPTSVASGDEDDEESESANLKDCVPATSAVEMLNGLVDLHVLDWPHARPPSVEKGEFQDSDSDNDDSEAGLSEEANRNAKEIRKLHLVEQRKHREALEAQGI